MNNYDFAMFCLSCCNLYFCYNLMSGCKVYLFVIFVVTGDFCCCIVIVREKGACYYKETEIWSVMCNSRNVVYIGCLIG